MKIPSLKGIKVPSLKRKIYTEEEIAFHNMNIVPTLYEHELGNSGYWDKVWKTRQEIAEELNISVETVRGKVQKGTIERIKEDGKYYYRSLA